jgi:hypothetical protein
VAAARARALLLLGLAACLVPAAQGRPSHLLSFPTKTFYLKGSSLEVYVHNKASLLSMWLDPLQRLKQPPTPLLQHGSLPSARSLCCPGYYDANLGTGLPCFCVPCGRGFFCNGARQQRGFSLGGRAVVRAMQTAHVCVCVLTTLLAVP